MTTQCNYQNR